MDDLAAALELARRDPRRQVGRFLLLGELGRGGMGVVYRAWDPAAERVVALKLLLDHDPEAIARFKREGDAVARLQHPGIVRVHEQGQVGARPFLVMELACGRPLDETPAPLPLAEAVALTRALCAALAHAHQRGVVHRDLKPANVLVGADGAPRILDFGLAKLLDRSHLTRSGTLLGTAAYMAPEQLDGRADERSDVYSLGATLYWLLTGRAPFTGESVQNVLVAVSQRPVEPPSRSNPAVTPEVEGVLLRCMEKDPAARYPSATAFDDALGRALGGARVERARRTPTIVALVGVALALAGGGWALSRRGTSTGAESGTEVGPNAFDPDAALADATQALARGDPGVALAAVTSARSAGASARVLRRAAALEGEARWLQGELDLVALRRASDPEGMELLDALGAATRTQSSSTDRRAPTRPAAAFARAIELGRAGLEAEAAAALALAGGADATRLAGGLLAADHAAAVRWLLPHVDADRLDLAAATALAREALAQLERDPQGARALARVARAAGLGPERDVMAGLLARALAHTAALSDEALTSGEAAKTPFASYRRALPPFRVALVVEPTVEPPGALVALVKQIHRTAPDDLEERECVTQSEGAKQAALDPTSSPRLTMDEALARLGELRDRALSPSSRREVAYVASELLTHAGRAQEACDWLAAAAEGGLGPEDHDFVVQWARVLHATLDPGRRAEAIALLGRVLDDDPLHGDARELRGRLLLDTGGDLDQAARDLSLAVHDYQRGRDSLQHPHRDPQGFLAAVEEARGNLERAWAACLSVRPGLQGGAWNTEVRERIRAKLDARRGDDR